MSNFYVIDICISGLCPLFPILKSATNSQIYVLFQILKSVSNSQNYVLFQILKSVSNSQNYVLLQILKSMAVSHFLKSTSNDVTDVCPNPNQ